MHGARMEKNLKRLFTGAVWGLNYRHAYEIRYDVEGCL